MTATLPPIPMLETAHLRLRPFTLADAPDIRLLAGEREVAANTLRIPHPYPEGAAEAWVLSRPGAYARGEDLALAAERRADGGLVGALGLMLALEDGRAELGYWIGKPYWGRGYATEAASALVAFAFERLGLDRIHASHFGRNPASGRVLAKIGMTLEGRQRSHILKWGEREDLVLYGILRSEWHVRTPTSYAAPPS